MDLPKLCSGGRVCLWHYWKQCVFSGSPGRMLVLVFSTFAAPVLGGVGRVSEHKDAYL